MTYKRLHGEIDADLVALCRRCHEMIHELIFKYDWRTVNRYIRLFQAEGPGVLPLEEMWWF